MNLKNLRSSRGDGRIFKNRKDWINSLVSPKLRDSNGRFIKGYKNPNKNRVLINCKQCNKEFEVVYSKVKEGKGLFCSKECYNYFIKGKSFSKETQFKKGHIPWIKGKKHSEETIKKIIKKNKGRVVSMEEKLKRRKSAKKGKGSPSWKGGVTKVNKAIRSTSEYFDWRNAVFERDKYTCQECGQVGGYLEAHHIKSLSKIIRENKIINLELAKKEKEIWNKDNGLTLCIGCHEKKDKYRRRFKDE